MADLMDSNEYLKKILIPQAQLPPVPMKLDYPVNASEQEDPADSLPAVEEDDESPEALAAAEAQYKLKPGNAHAVVTPGERGVEDTDLDTHLAASEAAQNARVDGEIFDSDSMQSPYAELGMPAETRMPATDESLLSKREALVSTYQQLVNAQKAAQTNAMGINILGGASKIAQGFATGAGAKIDANEAGIKSLNDQNAMAVNDIKDRIKLGGDEMNSPDSDISIFMREQAYAVLKKINPDSDYTDKLEGMSAEQLQKLPGMKSLGQGSGRTTAVGFGQFVNAKGEPIVMSPENKLINLVTEKPHKPEDGVARPIGYNDPVDGMRKYMGPGFAATLGNTGQSPKTKEEYRDEATGETKSRDVEAKTYGEYRKQGIVSPVEFNVLVNKDKEGFEQQNGAKVTIMSGLDSVERLANEAITNPNAAASLGGIIGSLFEPGKLTDEDALRYTRRLGLENKAKDWVTEAVSGTITAERSKEIVKTAKAYKSELDKIVRKNAVAYADRTRSGLIRGDEVKPEILANFYYTSQQAPESTSNMVRIKTPKGTFMDISKDKLKDALKEGATEVK